MEIMCVDSGVFADVRYDTAFKRCFGSEQFKTATIGLLNSVLPGMGINDVTFLSNELQGLSADDRKGVIDVLCKTDSGNHFIIEMQNARQKHFRERTYFYSSLLIVNQAKKGKWDFSLKEMYSVSFLNFDLPDCDELDRDRFSYRYVCSEVDTESKMPGSTEFLFFDLKSFSKTKEECKEDIEKWLYLLKHSRELEEMPAEFEGEAFETFSLAAHLASFSKNEMIQYNRDMVTENDRYNELCEAKAEAYADGREESAKEIAKTMKTKGLSIDAITECTGLSVNVINSL